MGNKNGMAWLKGRYSGILLWFTYFLTALLLRLPFFFRDYIDRDESTFILVGQSWVDGHLPYTQLWDLKPPMVFAFFAAIIWAFGKSFIAIRLGGVVLVSVVAWFTARMGREMGNVRQGFWAGMACIYLLSLFGSLQGVMSEHLSMAFFMPGLYLLFRKRLPERIFLSGLFFGLAMMTKLNLAYPVLMLGILLVLESLRQKAWVNAVGRAVIFGMGILFVLGLTSFPYAMAGHSGLWWDSVIRAPLAYSSAEEASVLKVAPLLVLVGLFFFLSYRKAWLALEDHKTQLLFMALVGVTISFLKVGRINGHYLIQFYPVFLLLLAEVLRRAGRKKWRWILPLILLLAPVESYLEYYQVAKHRSETGSYYNGEGIDVPRYLRSEGLAEEKVLFLEYHIGYWPLEVLPPLPSATHPSNLCRSELYPFQGNPRETALEELAYLMEEIRPGIVVVREGRRIFDREKEAENTYMQDYLDLNYRPIKRIGGALVLKRLQG